MRGARFLAPAFMAIVGAINLAHPFAHAFDGGTLDMVLVYLNCMAMQVPLAPRG